MASLKKRGKNYYAQVYVNGKQRRISLQTTSYKIAAEKLRQIESAHVNFSLEQSAGGQVIVRRAAQSGSLYWSTVPFG